MMMEKWKRILRVVAFVAAIFLLSVILMVSVFLRCVIQEKKTRSPSPFENEERKEKKGEVERKKERPMESLFFNLYLPSLFSASNSRSWHRI